MHKNRIPLLQYIVITCGLALLLAGSVRAQISNSGFESGISPWLFYTNGQGTLSLYSPGNNSVHAGQVKILSAGSNVQMYQEGRRLEANTQYTVSFKAYSSRGQDLSVSVQRETSPFTSYGMNNVVFNITTTWKTFTAEFTTSGFSGVVNNARLKFWFAPYDASGDQYFFDDVTIAKTGSPPGPAITQQPQDQTVPAGQTATFSVTATGTSPITYRWQKNNVNIVGATGATYTTPAVSAADNGSTFRVIVTNPGGSVTSNSAALTLGSQSILLNSGFESGTSPWVFYTNAQGSFAQSSPGSGSTYAGRVLLSTAGSNVQLYQNDLRLEANTQYTLSFKAYSNTGHDVVVFIQKHSSPYTSYGLDNTVFNLQTSWSTYSIQFTTAGFSGVINDGRLKFWFADDDAAGDQYFFDDIILLRVGATTAPIITQHPQSQNVAVGQTATFAVAASGAQPLSYRWQKNNVTISGATGQTYTTPPATTANDGSTFRAIVTNSAGSATSNSGVLTVQSGSVALAFQHVIIDNNGPRNPHCKAIGDINGDGFDDVLAASSTGFNEGLYWYRYPTWTKHSIHSGSFSTDMQVGDVDNDGDLDVIIPKGVHIGSSVWWYENPDPSGDPRNGPWVEHFIGNAGAHDVEVGDLNRDGKLDVVVRHELGTTVFFQNSSNSWTKKLVNSRAEEGTSLGDIDGDGDLDIAINGRWLENPLPTGNPTTNTWTERLISTNWPAQTAVHIRDINQDGRMDVLLAPSETANGRLSWYESFNPRSGPWTQHIIAGDVSYLHTLKTGDMDNDGDLDLVTAEMHQSGNPDEVSVLLNQGDALTWTKFVVATTGLHNLRISDIGNDGDLDIFGANWNDSAPNGAPIEMWTNITARVGTSLDNWTRRVVDPGKPWRSIFVSAADLNGDGKKDIITGGWWYRNPGSASGTWARTAFGSPLNNMAAVHDFDNDGDVDVLGTRGQGSATNAQFSWARNNGTGGFTILGNVPNGEGDFLQGVAVGQFQNPLEVALSWHNGTTGVQMLTVPASPSSTQWTWRRISNTTQGEELSAADIDRDGDNDLALGTQWLRNGGSTWSTFQINGTAGSPDRNRLADINRDGRLDIVVGFEAISVVGKLAWYEQPGTATSAWIQHVISSSVVGPMSLDVTDMDQDGDMDVVVGEHNLSNPGSARMLVFENNDGFGNSWTQHIVFTGDEHHDGAQVVDIDNDGDMDIISIGWNNTKVLLYENTSTNNAPSVTVTPAPENEQDATSIPTDFVLYRNYPNPFNPSTTIRYGLPRDAEVTINIYNYIGQTVRTIATQTGSAGYYEVIWDGKNALGLPAASGVYFCRMVATPLDGSSVFTTHGKMTLLK